MTRIKIKNMKLQGKISILIGQDYTRIELTDSLSSVRFLDIKLTPEQLSSALSRLALTPCEFEARGLDLIGKKMQNENFKVLLPKEFTSRDRSITPKIIEYCVKKLEEIRPGEGWIWDDTLQSQDSFLYKEDKCYANGVIRRWI